MIDANLIVLDGIGLYIVLAIILLVSIYVVLLAVAGIKDDERIDKLQKELRQLEVSNTALINENWRYRLKFGVLDVESTSPPPAAEPLLKEKP